jgi:tetratricopeptide (TPR) repeat protein
MKISPVWIFALPFAAACAAGGASPAGAPARTTAVAVQCPAGVNNAQTAFSRDAEQQLLRAQVGGQAARPALHQQALTQAQAGIAADANNPQHYFLAGQAHVFMGNYVAADSAFRRAETLCAAYGEETLPLREQAYATLYNQGLAAYQANDTAKAIAAWEGSTRIFDAAPDPYFNLAILRGARGEHEQAYQLYNQALAALERPTSDTTTAVADARADIRRNAEIGMLSVGGQLLQAKNYPRAAEVLERVTRLNANNREAWYNYALTLYSQERWKELVPVAQRAVQMDPLNENANIILFHALKNAGQNNEALKVLEATNALPVKVLDLQLDTKEEGRSVLRGQVEGNQARANSPVRLEVTFYGPTGTIGAPQVVTVNAPAKGAKTNVEVALQNPEPAVSYSYRVVR